MSVKPKGIVALAILVLLVLGATAGTLMAADLQQQATKPAPPVAKLTIVPVAANPADPNVIEATLSDGKTKVQMGTTGLSNVSVGVPVTLSGAAVDPKTPVTKYAWTLTAAAGSAAKLTATDKPTVKFTPDVSGIYKVDVVLSNDGGSSQTASVQIHAGEYIGTGIGNCFQCHPEKTQDWSETGHATMLKWQINGGDDPKTSHYGEGCVRCHSTGYYIGVQNGGFADLQAQTGWQFPALEDIQAGKNNWGAMPELLQNVGNIQCEDCHGPAKDHVQKGTKMAVSLDEGVCNVCHNGGGHHIKGDQFANSAHSRKADQAWTYPSGPDHQDCVRCHSGNGFITFIENPTDKASWDNDPQNATCAVCHDPHNDANAFQLRITGKPVEAAGVTKDFGLSATCVECHNARTTPNAAADAAKASFPHYSAGAEMLSGSGGVTYGQDVPNSPHFMIVGAAPVADPSDATGQAKLFKGNVPGPCVDCHMWPTPGAKDPNQNKVGEHSFNTVSPDGKFDYTAACQTCHPGVKDFNFTAKADYDGNGKVEGVQSEVAGLLAKLQGAIGDSGIKPVKGYPYFDQSGKANWTEKQKDAIYNYLFVRGTEESNGSMNAIHNFKRSVALLQLSYKDLTGKDVPGATLMK
ncbi:MAG TPA: multiheme c-type cytochrome [Chloroflexota bacterium]